MFWQGSEYTSDLVFLPSILCSTFFDLSLQEDEAVSVTLKQFSLQLDLQKSFCAKQWKKSDILLFKCSQFPVLMWR